MYSARFRRAKLRGMFPAIPVRNSPEIIDFLGSADFNENNINRMQSPIDNSGRHAPPPPDISPNSSGNIRNSISNNPGIWNENITQSHRRQDSPNVGQLFRPNGCPRHVHNRRDGNNVRTNWFTSGNIYRPHHHHHHRNSRHHHGLFPNAPPPYPVHENLWNIQQNTQELHRRLMTTLDFTPNSRPNTNEHTRSFYCASCDRRHPINLLRRRVLPQREVSQLEYFILLIWLI